MAIVISPAHDAPLEREPAMTHEAALVHATLALVFAAVARGDSAPSTADFEALDAATRSSLGRAATIDERYQLRARVALYASQTAR